MNQMIAVVLGLMLSGAIAGWFVGWIARGEENRRYAESRLRALAADAVLDAYMPVESERLPAPPPASAVVNVHLAVPQVAAQPWPVLSGQVVPELPQG